MSDGVAEGLWAERGGSHGIVPACLIFTFGVGTLCATGVCHFSDEVINELLGQDFMAMLARIKSGASQQPTVHPIQKL